MIRFLNKHNRLFLISILSVIILFLIGNFYAHRKAYEQTEKLMNRLIKENLNNKKSTLQKELEHFENLIHENEIIKKLKNEKNKLILSNDLIPFLTEHYVDNLKISTSFINEVGNNSVFKNNSIKYLHRIIKLKKDNKLFYISYDMNLTTFWKEYTNSTATTNYYTIVTNDKGICVLHPDYTKIGKHLSHIFTNGSISSIVKNNINNSLNQESEYLGIAVKRYFDTIITKNGSFVLIINYPKKIFFNENITDITKYFRFIDIIGTLLLAFIFFLAQKKLQKDFNYSLKKEKEKNELAILNEQYKEKNSLLQLNQLKKIMNPHFLFNALNSLVTLIDTDKKLSKKFVLKLAEVYRYFLENKRDNIVSIDKELQFIENYFFLHKIRFGNSIELHVKNKASFRNSQKKIPFLALETLIENALKHNIISKENPLKINCVVTDDLVIISNTYNPKTTKEQNSHKIGLEYLSNFYSFYNNKNFKYDIENNYFVCYLPLLTM